MVMEHGRVLRYKANIIAINRINLIQALIGQGLHGIGLLCLQVPVFQRAHQGHTIVVHMDLVGSLGYTQQHQELLLTQSIVLLGMVLIVIGQLKVK
jgi:hypothetical protein